VGERAGPRDGRRRRLFIDLTPLRRSRDLRCLVLGELISVLGSQLTTVAVPYQVYQLTRSSLDVGLVSLAQLVPLIAGPACARSSRASASYAGARPSRGPTCLTSTRWCSACRGPCSRRWRFGDTVSVVSGGLACIAGALILARLLPGFRRQQTRGDDRDGHPQPQDQQPAREP